ncbi:50S ribosomal protein L5 [Candidatus Peregrinibacteria bacterium]|nr:50S ribosomal protein L5 [Candidatus Peregrinibacteria bacterium]
MSNQFQEHFKKEIIPRLMKELNIKNIMAVPRITKVKINVGIGTYLAGGKDYSEVVKNITEMSGQKPIVTHAKKAISNFKIRIGLPVGITVTLRKKRMYDFVNKLVNSVLPRTRDFRGIPPKSFDKKGNYSLGISEFTVFPEIRPEDIVKNHGVEITIVTSAKNDEEGYALLKNLGFPFKRVSSGKIAKKT